MTAIGSSKSLIFGYEKNAPMVGLNAPARRVGLFMFDNTAASFNENGWKLFEAAVLWASGGSSPTPTPTPTVTPTPTPTVTPTPSLSPTEPVIISYPQPPGAQKSTNFDCFWDPDFSQPQNFSSLPRSASG